MKEIKEMKKTDKGFFKTFIPLETNKGKIQIFEKDLGDGISKKFLRGTATNTLVDKEDERMSKNFVDKIKQSALGLNVFSEHNHSIDKTVGFVEDVGGDYNNVVVDVALEDENENSIVKSILNKIKHGTKIGYSIGGRILKAKRTFDEDLKKWINEIEDGEIYEISLTAMPAGVGTWVEPIQKSLNDLVDKEDVDIDKDEIKKQIQKALDEMLQENQIRDEMWDIFYAFRSAMYTVVESDQLTPEAKKSAIMNLATEFGTKVEEFSIKIVELTNAIEEQLGLN